MTRHAPADALVRSALLLGTLLAAACNSYSDAAYRDALAKGGTFEVPEDRTDITTTNAEEEEDEEGERYVCVDREYSIERAPLDYATFDPSAEVIYPGSLLQGATLADATPEPIAVERAPGTVSIDLVNGSRGVSADVDQVTYSAIQGALNEILANNNGQGAARFTLESSEVQSREQLALALGVNVSTLAGEVDADLAFSSDTSLNRWVVKLTQSYYTMTYDLPTSLDDVFAPSVSPKDLERYVGPGNPAAYVSSVTYGRVFYLLVETTASRKDLEASISASYSAAVVGGELDASATYVTDLANAKVKVFALGGDPSLALATFSGSFEAVRDFLTEGGDITTGKPLSYKLRSVVDNRTVYVKVATEYTVRECIPVDLSLPSPIAWYDASQGIDAEAFGVIPNGVTAWHDAWADDTMVALPPDGWRFGGWIAGPPGTDPDTAGSVNFTNDNDQNYRSGYLMFPGNTLRNTDFTIFIVVLSQQRPDVDKETWFMWGNNDNDLQGLTLGFDGNRSVFMSMGGSSMLAADLDIDAQSAFHLITYWFSQEEGARIYVNGQLRAEDPDMKEPLLGFSGARFGCGETTGQGCVPDSLEIAQIKMVGEALDERTRDDAETVILVSGRL
ncbi:MAG: thiol-activated cytolysin family protein [Alphaproteobacteria bacterium]|nr:thiol-activated cytolysin family protein [Alphaproteobacteria bacterium]